MALDFLKVLWLGLAVCLLNSLCARGAFLQLDQSNTDIPNNSILDPAVLSDTQGVSCCGGTGWLYPNNTAVRERGFSLIVINRDPCLELMLETGLDYSHITEVDEGVYTCTTEGNTEQQYIGIYTQQNYATSDGPVLSEMVLELSSAQGAYPPSFTLNCPSTAYPPTHVAWTPASIGLFSTLITSTMSTSYNNILTVADFTTDGSTTVTCSVGNIRGSSEMSKTILAPSGVPTGLQLLPAGDSVVTVSWTPLEHVLGHTVMYNDQRVTVGPVSSANITDLQADVEYSIRVQGFGDLPGPTSSPVTITLQGVGAPIINSVSTVSATSLRVTWSPPDEPTTIVGYRLSYSPLGLCDGHMTGSQLIDRQDTTEAILTNLEPGVEYEVSVQARGIEAFGDRSGTIMGSTDISVPSGPPRNVTIEPRSESPALVVRWLPPACQHINSLDGITGYTVRYRAQGTESWTSNTIPDLPSLTVASGIEVLVAYEVQVAARNERGMGVFSSSVLAAVVAGAVPGSVKELSAQPDIISVLVNWEPPAVGQDYISSYKLCSKPASARFQNCLFLNGESLRSHRIEHLVPTTEYLVSLSAFIAGSEGPVEEMVVRTNSVEQVSDVRVSVIREGTVNVSWSQLDSTDVYSYRVFYHHENILQQVDVLVEGENGSSVVIDSLHPGAGYSFTVVAVVLVNNVEQVGQASEITAESSITIEVNSGLLAAALVLVVVILVLLILGIIAIACYRRYKSKSGRFEISGGRRPSLELFKSRPSPTRISLASDFDKSSIAHTKPVIQSYPKDVIAVEGETVVFAPRVSGNPTPNIAWFFNGHMVTSDYACEVGEDGSLKFFCVEDKHVGMYRFTVSNNGGSVQGQVCLYVRGGDGIDGGFGPPTVKSSQIALDQFGEYIEQLHSSNNKGFRDQFYSLPGCEENQSTDCALSPENKYRNRFTNIVAYDATRVELIPLPGHPHCQHNYINASYIDGYSTKSKFIATQGPMEKTLTDFWRLVWQERPQMIVMITNLREGTRNKCAQYWPQKKGQKSFNGPFSILLLDTREFADFTVRTIELCLPTESGSPVFRLTQFHYTSWPDHGVPDYVGPMLAYHRRIASEYKPIKGPVLIHCSAGVGRTGTFIAIDIALEQVENENVIDIPAIITRLRQQRMKLVQTDEQFVFVHDAVFESLMCGSTQIPAWEVGAASTRLDQISTHTRKSGFQHQFEILAKVTPKPGSLSCASGLQNPNKNRCKDYLPPEKHRVILKAEYPDYIHASFINGYRKKRGFILTQGPMKNTCRDFWKMVYERNCTSIVMLSALQENRMDMCYHYWPVEGESVQYGEYVVSDIELIDREGYTERVFGVTDSKSGQTQRVSHYQLSNHTDVGMALAPPSNYRAVLSVIDAVISTQKANIDSPIIVHCSDTVSRSCVFIAATILTECCRAEGLVDVFQVVKALRVQKPGAIPNVGQYAYIHNLLMTAIDLDNHSLGLV